MPTKRWLLPAIVDPTILASYTSMRPLLAAVLYNRGMQDHVQARAFLQGTPTAHGAWLGMRQKRTIDRAIDRIRQAIRAREKIAVYGDFDADGVTSTALMMLALQSLGADAMPYIPHRVDEGYGLNGDALAKLRQSGVKVVITVDCGIRSIDEVLLGTQYGLDLIVTDHHSVGADVPEALAVINPKLTDCSYPEPMLAGVGVAYRLAEALLRVSAHSSRNNLRPLDPDTLLDLVAIGTVADLAPLDRLENRQMVADGLARMNRSPRPGLRALMQVAGLKGGAISARDIGFGIGPRINAAGRLDSAMRAYELLMTADDDEAADLAGQLDALNRKRQEMTQAAQELIRTQIAAREESDWMLIIAGSAEFVPGIVGLVAGRLTEEFYRPSIVLEYGETESRASCRSIPQFDITRALDECADLLVRHGGHAQAAGFTVLNENLPALEDRLQGIAGDWMRDQELTPSLEIDAELDPRDVDLASIEDLAQLEPTGHHNAMPSFVAFNLLVREARIVGKDANTLKLVIERPGTDPMDAIGFRMADRPVQAGERIDAVFSLDINVWKDRRIPQMRLIDIVPAGSADVVRA